jgi:hypothetical protein
MVLALGGGGAVAALLPSGNDWVLLEGVHGATLALLTGSGGTSPPPSPPPGRRAASLLRHEPGDHLFTNAAGEAVWLAGLGTWTSVQDRADAGPFDWNGYLGLLEATGSNVARLWTFVDTGGRHGELSPLPYAEVSPGVFDLERLNQGFYDRLDGRVGDLNERGIYADVVLFDLLGQIKTPESSPFRGSNNVNGVDAGPDEVAAGSNPAVVAAMERHARQTVETLKDMPNVLYEIANEPDQRALFSGLLDHLVNVVREADGGAHPVGIGAPAWGLGNHRQVNDAMLRGGADWFSPDGEDYLHGSPPRGDGSKAVVWDTDHFDGHGVSGGARWVWQAFTTGAAGYMQMDTLHGMGISGVSPTFQVGDGGAGERGGREGIRQTMLVSRMIDLNGMREAGRLSSTGFAIADPADGEFVVYAPRGGSVTLDLSGARGQLQVFWVDVDSGAVTRADAVTAGAVHSFHSPCGHSALVLTGQPLI